MPPVNRPWTEASVRRPGETVVLREVWRGRVWAARPAIVVQDGPAERRFFVPAGTRWRAPIGPDGALLRLPADDWTLAGRVAARSVLSFAWPDRAYAVLAFWERDRLTGLYVNLQTTLRPSPAGFDYMDNLLDVVVAPDRRTWRWKDRDELAEAVRRGIFTTAEAGEIRNDGRRAIEHVTGGAPPFDRDWSGWRPDPGWPVPELPGGWEVVRD